MTSTLKSYGIDSSRTLTTDSLSIWLQRAVQLTSSSDNSINFGKIVSDEDAQNIFTFVCDFWTDSGVAFGNSLKELFIKIISLVTISRPTDSIVYLQKWTQHILRFSRNQRVLYFMLEILAKKVGGQFVLDDCPEFLSQSLAFMGSNALANPIGKSLFAIYSSILTQWTGDAKNNITCDSEIAEKWTQLWSEPTRSALLNEKTREHVQTYFLPQMFKRLPQSLGIFIKPMTNINFDTPENEISVLLGCMKLGHELGILDVFEEGNNVISEEFLESLFHHESPVLRIGALSLVSIFQQTTRPVAKFVFKVLERSLDDFFVESDPGFRNQFYGFIRQFIFRVRASSYSIKKESNKKAKNGDIELSTKLAKEVEFVKEFFVWLISYLERCLRPSAPYQYRFTAMLLIQLLANSGLDDEIRPECYEKHHDFFPFKIPVYNEEIVRLLIENIANNFEDVRATAAKIIGIAKLPLPLIESYEQIETLANQSLSTLSGMRGREGDAGARGLELAFNLYFNFPVPESNANSNIEHGLSLFETILSKLEDEIEFANKNMATAVREHPIHGYYTALAFILGSIDFYKFSSTPKDEKNWTELIKRLIKSMNNVWENVKEILCHDSPEGNLPKEFEANFEPELEAQYGPATQVILSYSWRAIKESTAMLKVLFDRVPLKGSTKKKSPVKIQTEIFPQDLIVEIGELLLTQLATVRHRGAFSSIYPAFVSCCKRCNLTPGIENQPEKWLSENINLIKIKAQYVTRRSGGLPYLITAVLTAELEPTLDLITSTFEKLLTIAQIPAVSSGSDKIDLPQVHAFNCIKAMFVETNLSSRSAYFIEPSLELAIMSFSSEIWAIRNCAVMLFTALQNRLFGTAKPTKSKLTNSTISAKIFFNKYKTIRETLLRLLQHYVDHMDETSSGVEIVFPILSLLSRLESTVGYNGLDDFRPLAVSCLGSKIWKVREMTARVIPPLLGDQDTIKFLRDLIDDASLKNQNKLHGVCLAGLNIVISKIQAGADIPQDFIEFFFKKFDEFVIFNPSPETALAYLRIIKEIFLVTPDNQILVQKLVPKCAHLWKNLPGSGMSSARRVFQSELAEISLVNAFNINGDPLALATEMVLCYESYEVQLMAIEQLSNRVDYLTGTNSAQVLQALWAVFASQAWDQVRGPAARLFSQIFAKFAQDASAQSFRDDVPKYWQVLYSSVRPGVNTEEINESCLEALGIFSGQLYCQEADDRVNKWLELVSRFSDENEAYPARDAALTSLLAFLSTIKIKQGAPYADALLQLFFFLSDDDEDIRATASEYVSRMLGLRFLATSAHCENQLLRERIVSCDSSAHIARQLFSYLTERQKSATDLLAEARAVDDALFNYEKQNLFRDEVAKFEQVGGALLDILKNNDTLLREEIEQWITDAVPALKSTIAELGGDETLLIWGKDPKITKEVSRIIIVARIYEALEGVVVIEPSESIKAMLIRI